MSFTRNLPEAPRPRRTSTARSPRNASVVRRAALIDDQCDMAEILYGGGDVGNYYTDDLENDGVGRTSPPRSGRWGRGRPSSSHEEALYAASREVAAERAAAAARAEAAAAAELSARVASAARQAARVRLISNLAKPTSSTASHRGGSAAEPPTLPAAAAPPRRPKAVAFEVSAVVDADAGADAGAPPPPPPPTRAAANTAFFRARLPSPERAQQQLAIDKGLDFSAAEAEATREYIPSRPGEHSPPSANAAAAIAAALAQSDAAALAAADAAAAAADAAAAAAAAAVDSATRRDALEYRPAPPGTYALDSAGAVGAAATASADTSIFDAAEALDEQVDSEAAATAAAAVAGIDARGRVHAEGGLLASLDDNYFQLKSGSNDAAIGGLLAAIDDGYFTSPPEDAAASLPAGTESSPARAARRAAAARVSPSRGAMRFEQGSEPFVGTFSHTRGSARVSSNVPKSSAAAFAALAGSAPRPTAISSFPTHASLWPNDLRRADASRDVMLHTWSPLDGAPAPWGPAPKPLPPRKLSPRLSAVESKIGDLVRGARAAAKASRAGAPAAASSTQVPVEASVLVAAQIPSRRSAALEQNARPLRGIPPPPPPLPPYATSSNPDAWHRQTFAGLPAVPLEALIAATREAHLRPKRPTGVAWQFGATVEAPQAHVTAVEETLASSIGLNPSQASPEGAIALATPQLRSYCYLRSSSIHFISTAAPIPPPRLNSPPRLPSALQPPVSPVGRTAKAIASAPASAPAPPPVQPSHRKAAVRSAPPAPVAQLSSVRLGSAGSDPLSLTEQLMQEDSPEVAATSDELYFASALIDEPGSSAAGGATDSMALHDSIDEGEPLDVSPQKQDAAAEEAPPQQQPETTRSVSSALASDLLREATIAEAQANRLRAAFKLFDTDGSGSISTDELSSVMTALGRSPSPRELSEMISQADLNNDGVCDFNEFCEMMRDKL